MSGVRNEVDGKHGTYCRSDVRKSDERIVYATASSRKTIRAAEIETALTRRRKPGPP